MLVTDVGDGCWCGFNEFGTKMKSFLQHHNSVTNITFWHFMMLATDCNFTIVQHVTYFFCRQHLKMVTDITVRLNPDYEISLFKTLKAKKEEFAQFCMMAKARIGKDFKAEINTGSKSQRSFPSPRSNSFLGRLLDETNSRTAGCTNQEWQFDFVCPVFLNTFQQAYSKFMFWDGSCWNMFFHWSNFLVKIGLLSLISFNLLKWIGYKSILSENGMSNAELLCEYLHNMIGQQDSSKSKCWDRKTKRTYQSGKFLIYSLIHIESDVFKF